MPEEYGPAKLLSFTRHLISNNDNYRALHELNRINFLYPDYINPALFFITKHYLLYRGGQYDSILAGSAKYTGPGIQAHSSMYMADALIGLHSYREAHLYAVSADHAGGIEIGRFMYKRRLFTYLMAPGDGDEIEYRALSQDRDFSKYDELIEFSRKEHSSLKSPVLAAFIGVVPGAGYAYSGNTSTGLVALIVVSINAAISYYAFRNGNQPIGLFVGAMGTFFYGGSILGGYMSAANYNKMQMDSLHNRLINDFNFSSDHDYLYNNFGLGRDDNKQ